MEQLIEDVREIVHDTMKVQADLGREIVYVVPERSLAPKTIEPEDLKEELEVRGHEDVLVRESMNTPAQLLIF